MAWVRYDDTFYSNPKVTGVVHDDPGALSLHLLANTWTNGQKHPGFVPAHQPAVLLCDKQLGVRWAEVLVRAGLWHKRYEDECDECLAEYADLPPSSGGWVFHNAREYRAPARDRLSPGTPDDLSEKRRAAGRKGGRTTAARRKQDEAKQSQAKEATALAGQESGGTRLPGQRSAEKAADGQPTLGDSETLGPAQTEFCWQASADSKSSNLLFAGVSPEPVPVNTSASNEAEPVGTEPTPTQRAFGVARGWIAYRKDQGTPVIASGRGKEPEVHKLKNLIEPFLVKGYSDSEVKHALTELGESIPSTSSLDRMLSRLRNQQSGRLNGGMNSRPTRRLHNSHDNQDRYDIKL